MFKSKIKEHFWSHLYTTSNKQHRLGYNTCLPFNFISVPGTFTFTSCNCFLDINTSFILYLEIWFPTWLIEEVYNFIYLPASGQDDKLYVWSILLWNMSVCYFIKFYKSNAFKIFITWYKKKLIIWLKWFHNYIIHMKVANNS